MVAAFSAAVAANAMITLQVLGTIGQAAVLGFVSISFGIVGAAVAIDILSRSSQGLATLRTMGARRETIAASMVANLVAFGVIGSVLGAVLGFGLVETLIRSGSLILGSLLIDALFVLGISAVATGAGVYAGVRTSWHN